MVKFYINGKEVSKRQFRVCNYSYNALTHYAVVNGKTTTEWGRVPRFIIKRKKKEK